MKKIKLITIILLILSSCTPKKKLTMFTNTSISAGFDTYINIKASAKSEDEFDRLFNESINDFIYLNKLFDIYKNYEGINNIKTINDNAGIAPIKVDPIIIDLLKQAKAYYDLSNQEFDITLGPVLKIWHKYRVEGIDMMNEGKLGAIPSAEELNEAAKCIGWQNVEIDENNQTVYLKNSCSSLDVGGIAKGYASEFVANNLEKKNVKVAVVDAGGNNRTINSKLDGTPWKVGIQNPNGSADSIIAVSIDGSMSFVTSGDYQRYYIADDGNAYHHIINPKTLFPAGYYHSVSVITNNSSIADILSTTLFTLSYEEGLDLIKKFKSDHPDMTLEVVWITNENYSINTEFKKEKNNYNIVYTEGLKDKITWQ